MKMETVLVIPHLCLVLKGICFNLGFLLVGDTCIYLISLFRRLCIIYIYILYIIIYIY